MPTAFPSNPHPGEEDWALEFPETENEQYLLREGWLPLRATGEKGERVPARPMPGRMHKSLEFFCEDNRLGGAREEKFRRIGG